MPGWAGFATWPGVFHTELFQDRDRLRLRRRRMLGDQFALALVSDTLKLSSVGGEPHIDAGLGRVRDLARRGRKPAKGRR